MRGLICLVALGWGCATMQEAPADEEPEGDRGRAEAIWWPDRSLQEVCQEVFRRDEVEAELDTPMDYALRYDPPDDATRNASCGWTTAKESPVRASLTLSCDSELDPVVEIQDDIARRLRGGRVSEHRPLVELGRYAAFLRIDKGERPSREVWAADQDTPCTIHLSTRGSTPEATEGLASRVLERLAKGEGEQF